MTAFPAIKALCVRALAGGDGDHYIKFTLAEAEAAWNEYIKAERYKATPLPLEPVAADHLERARELIERIAADSRELETLYGPLWARLGYERPPEPKAAGPEAVRPISKDVQRPVRDVTGEGER